MQLERHGAPGAARAVVRRGGGFVPRVVRAATLALVLATAITLDGCSEVTLPGPDARIPQTIVIVPGDVTLSFDNGKAAVQDYRAFGYFDRDAGATPPDLGPGDDSGVPPGAEEITDKVQWSVELSTLGRFEGSQFRTEVSEGGAVVPARHGGVSRVVARLGDMAGYADITVKYSNTFLAGTAPSDAAKKFSGKPTAGAITIHYPPSQVLVPPNLGQMDVQYSKGRSTNDLFRIRLTGKLVKLTIYTTETSHNLNIDQWKAVGTGAMGDKVSLIVDGTRTSAPATRSLSKTTTIKIAESKLRGGLYYWVVSQAASGKAKDDQGIYRYDFDKPTPSSEAYYTQKDANDCVGCHSLSRGGDYVAFTKSGGSGNTAILDVKRRQPVVDSKYRGDLQTFSPSGEEVIVVHRGVLTRRKVSSGALLETIPTGPGKATHPDWSADGKSLAYVRVKDADYFKHEKGYKIEDDVHFRNGSIVLLTRKADGSWSAPRVLVAGGGGVNNYYPSFSPGSDWIVFNRSTGDSYSDIDASIHIVRPSGKGRRALTRLNLAKMSNSWPRWAPFVQKYGNTTLYWLTFSSVRNYGVKLLNSKVAKYEDKAPQNWMTSFDTKAAAAGKDPTSPPFWLPFQDLDHHNHIAQWTEKVLAVE